MHIRLAIYIRHGSEFFRFAHLATSKHSLNLLSLLIFLYFESFKANTAFYSEPMALYLSNIISDLMNLQILHVMTASLHHARPILAAALNAGFRESGVQSLKCLDDPNAFPMVAIRTAGLGLDSVIGFCTEDSNESDNGTCPLIDDNHLRFLMTLGNERFKANKERIRRLEEELRRIERSKKEHNESEWEDKAVRAERKRNDGLREQARRQQRAVERCDDMPSLLDLMTSMD